MRGKVTVLGKYVWLLLFCMAGIAISMLCSCRTKYIPVEIIKTEIVHNTDTFIQHDSVKTHSETILREARPEDSAMIAKLGIRLQDNERLLILLQNQLREAQKEIFEHKTDTVVRVDSVDVPIPVERDLTSWEKVKMDYGTFAIGGTLVAVILLIMQLVRWIRRKDK